MVFTIIHRQKINWHLFVSYIKKTKMKKQHACYHTSNFAVMIQVLDNLESLNYNFQSLYSRELMSIS
jgi:hypothetical protein